MDYILYADLYFLINFCLDFVVVYLTAKILRRRVRLWRALIAVTLGAGYAVFCAMLPGRAFYYIPLTILSLMAMCLIAFGYKSHGKFAAVCAMVTGVSFTLGGAMQAAYSMWMRSLASGGVISRMFLSAADRFPLRYLVILFLLAAAAALALARIMERAKISKTGRVEVTFLGRHAAFEALVDTGNMLTEPISGRPVIIVDGEIAARLLPGAEGAYDIMRLSSLSVEVARRVRIIPLTTIGGDGVIAALLCDRLSVNGIEKTGCIGIYPGKKDFSGYNSILPASLV